MAVMAPQQISRTRYEIRRKPRLDIVRDFLGGTVFGVAQAALARHAPFLKEFFGIDRISSIYGMNLKGLPFQDSPYGAEWVGGVTIVVTTAMATIMV